MTSSAEADVCSNCGAATAGNAVCPSCGTAIARQGMAAPRNDYPPAARKAADLQREIGRFKIMSVLGTGGFATVYRAEDSQLGRQVALKLLHAHLVENTDFVRRFEEEARASARLRHRNIVRIYDAAESDDGRPYLVMELLEGTLLSQIIAQRAPLPLGEAVSMITQLASALDYLHRQGLIHRDLKPSNVMVDESGLVTLMDFGIVRSFFDEAHLTLPGRIVGTPTYIAPEQVTGGDLGPASDIYSLGIVAYELFAGRPPFRGNSTQILHAHAYEPPPPLRDLRTRLPELLYTAVERALAKDPADRYATAGEFAADLARRAPRVSQSGAQAAIAPPADSTRTEPATTASAPAPPELVETPVTESASATVPPPQASEARRSKRSPLLLLAALAGLALLVIAVAAAVILTRRGSQKQPEQAPTRPATVQPAQSGSAAVATLKVTAPANGATVNSSVVIKVEESGVPIKPATENDPAAAHFHYFIDRDPSTVIKPGQPIPTGQADIIHSGDSNQALADLRPGPHTIWVVLAHTDHTPYVPTIDTKLTFTVVPAADAVQTFSGVGRAGFADGAANVAQFNEPGGVAVDAAGTVYVADTKNNRVRRIGPDGAVSTVAGSGAGQLDGPRGVAVDRSGIIYVADTGNNRIRKVTPDGAITTLAGTDNRGLGGGGFADGTGTAAQFRLPAGIAVDGSGNLYVADTGNNRIRKVTPAGEVTTIAGSGDLARGGFADGPGNAARFNAPRGIAVDASGNVYVADTFNQRIRKIAPNGQVSTLAGSGDQGTTNGALAVARFSNPDGVAVDADGNLYISDNASFRIRKLLSSGVLIDLAGTGSEGFTDGPPTSARFDFPAGMAVDSAGNVYVGDSFNHRVRKIVPFKQSR